MVAAPLEMRILTQSVEQRLESNLHLQAIGGRRYSASPMQTQCELLRDILRSGGGEDETRTRDVDLSRPSGQAPTRHSPSLLTVGAQDHPVAAAECSDQCHRRA